MTLVKASSVAGFEQDVAARLATALSRVRSIPIAVLIWGPDPTFASPFAAARSELREVLVREGHVARFSEELIDPKSDLSLIAQQAAQVEVYDIVFSLPTSPGSIAEIHEFARTPDLAHKIVAFVNNAWTNGFSGRALIELESTATCRITQYDEAKLPDSIVVPAVNYVKRLQEHKFLSGVRF